jgi:hypothetical protein
MPKQGSTVQRTNDIIDIFNGVRCKPVAEIEYFDGEWKSFDDVKSFSFSRSSKNKDVGRFALYPIPQQMNADIDNRFSKYSPGTESIFAGVIRRNLPIRASIGYALDGAISKQYDYTLAGLGELCYTQEFDGKIFNSPVRGSGSVPYGFTYPVWDGDEYDELTLAIDGYYQSSIIDFGVFKTKTLKQFKLTSDTTAIAIYYRVSNVREDLTDNIVAYTLLGNTIVGEKTFSLPDIGSRYFQFMLAFDTNVWSSTTGYATDIKVVYDDIAEMFHLGDFLLDTASWSSSQNDKSLSISARDKLKKALETKVSTDAYTGDDVAEIMRDVADRASIPHNDGVTEYIPDSGHTVDIVAHKNEKVINIF